VYSYFKKRVKMIFHVGHIFSFLFFSFVFCLLSYLVLAEAPPPIKNYPWRGKRRNTSPTRRRQQDGRPEGVPDDAQLSPVHHNTTNNHLPFEGMTGKTVAIAGAGDVAKYLVEELIKQGHHKVVVLSRAVRAPLELWLSAPSSSSS
jgi:hypothetical protein